MENASDALKMSVAALIFVSALTLTIIAFTKARTAATSILSKSDNLEYYNTENIRVSKDRIVGIETVIPTLYSYFKEGYTILFYDGRDAFDRNTQELRDGAKIKPLTLYYSEALETRIALSKVTNPNDSVGKFSLTTGAEAKQYYRAIYGFDANDEDSRQEPWLHDEVHAKEFIKSFINNVPDNSASGSPSYDFVRKTFADSYNNLDRANNKLYMDFNLEKKQGTFYGVLGAESLAVATNARFIERIGVYNQTATIYDDENIVYNSDSSVVEFTNNETIQNTEGTQKRVIQYIFIGNEY